MGTLTNERVGIAGQIINLAADLHAIVETTRALNPKALEDPVMGDRLARAWTEMELTRLLVYRALSKVIRGEKGWPEVPFSKLQYSILAQTLAELAVDLLGPAGLLTRGGPDAVDRGKWTRLYAFNRYTTIGGGSTEVQKNIIADRAIKLPGQARSPDRGRHVSPARDPRSPCLIGVGRHTWHPDECGPDGAPEPLEMWADVARMAADDSGAGDALSRLDRVDVVYCQSWQYDDPAGRLSERIGASPRVGAYSGIGGTVPQVLVSHAARDILAGRLDLSLVVGAEGLATKRRLKKAGTKPQWQLRAGREAAVPLRPPLPPGRSGPPHLRGVAHLRHVRQRPPRPPGHGARRVPP